MGNKQSEAHADQKRWLEFKEQFNEVGDQKDARYGEYKLFESKTAKPSTLKEKVVVRVMQLTSEEEFVNLTQLYKRREQLKSPFLCKLHGFIDTSEVQICGRLPRISVLYEYCNYDLEMDLVNRSRLTNNHPEKVNLLQTVFQRKRTLVYFREHFERPDGSSRHRSISSRCSAFQRKGVGGRRNKPDRFSLPRSS